MNDYKHIPESLKNIPNWVCWFKNEKGKIPINAKTLKLAKVNDETTYSSFDVALATYEKFKNNSEHKLEGLGFVFRKENNIIGIDIDYKEKYKDTFENVKNDILKIVLKNNSQCYIEKSQSGKGIHILLCGSLTKDNDVFTYKNRKDNLEIYEDVRFFALTGDVVENDTHIIFNNLDLSIDNSLIIKEIQDKYFSEKKENKFSFVFKNVDVESAKINTSNNNNSTTSSISDILNKIKQSKQGSLFDSLFYGNWQGRYDSQSSADLAFCTILAFWFNKDVYKIDYVFRTSNLFREKWDEKHGKNTYGEMTILKAIEGVSSTYSDIIQEKENNYKYNFNNININKDTGEIEEDFTSSSIDYTKYDLNDTGNAKLFIDTFKDKIKYNFDRREWMIYQDNKWCVDFTNQIKCFADELIDKLKSFSLSMQDKDTSFYKSFVKNIARLSSSSGKDAMLKEATHIQSIATKNWDYDKEDNLLNCKNCVVDLSSCETTTHDSKLMLSKSTTCEVDFKKYKEPKLWIKFLNDIFNNDENLIEYIQKALGYTLTGNTNEQCLFFNIGNGSNGKSVLFNTIYNIMGDYASNIQIETLLYNKNANGASASPDVARLNNARFVRTTEASEGQRFNEGLIKQLTGNDVITARYLYADFFEFTPKFKLWIACNNRIIIRGTDKGIWRRIKSIDYTQTFEGEKVDKHLEEKLMQDKDNILMWCILGAKKWYKEGLGECEAVNKSITSYKEEMDVITQFINEKCVVNDKERTKASVLFEEYKNYCKSSNCYTMSLQKFGIELSKRFSKKVIAGCNYYLGIILKKNSSQFIFERKE